MSLTFQTSRRGIMVLMASTILARPVLAAAVGEDLGPPVGMAAPDIGTPLDQTGKARALGDLMGKNGLVLLFFRSAEWCPYCQRQLMDVNEGLADITKRGYRVAALSYDKPEILAAFTEKRHIAYTLLSDPTSEVIDRYKLRDPQYPPGNRAFGVPRPIIFILDTRGVIRAKLFEETYKTRPPVSAVVEKLDQLAR